MTLVFWPSVKEPFLSQYRCGPLLGSGGFGSVFSGQRLSDGLQVNNTPPVFVHYKICAFSPLLLLENSIFI